MKRRYSDYREDLRIDFWFSCAYCSVAETEAFGIGFEIDHYLPEDKHPELSRLYGNLIYSCARCNGWKSNISREKDGLPDYCFFLRPDMHDEEEHYQLSDDKLFLDHLTDTGEFNITVLKLNRSSLQRLRKIRVDSEGLDREIMVGIRALADTRADGLREQYRIPFMEYQERANEQALDLSEKAQGFLADRIARSPLLDADPSLRESTKDRREYLNRIGAKLPDDLK